MRHARAYTSCELQEVSHWRFLETLRSFNVRYAGA
jgi:hypothetical protein